MWMMDGGTDDVSNKLHSNCNIYIFSIFDDVELFLSFFKLNYCDCSIVV